MSNGGARPELKKIAIGAGIVIVICVITLIAFSRKSRLEEEQAMENKEPDFIILEDPSEVKPEAEETAETKESETDAAESEDVTYAKTSQHEVTEETEYEDDEKPVPSVTYGEPYADQPKLIHDFQQSKPYTNFASSSYANGFDSNAVVWNSVYVDGTFSSIEGAVSFGDYYVVMEYGDDGSAVYVEDADHNDVTSYKSDEKPEVSREYISKKDLPSGAAIDGDMQGMNYAFIDGKELLTESNVLSYGAIGKFNDELCSYVKDKYGIVNPTGYIVEGSFNKDRNSPRFQIYLDGIGFLNVRYKMSDFHYLFNKE